MRARIKGVHIVLDLYGVDPQLLDDSSFIDRLIARAIEESGLKSIGTLSHKFQPIGYTAITLLTSSHISIHTWPEYGYAAVDIFSCDDREKALKAAEIIVSGLRPRRLRRVLRQRGFVVKKEESCVVGEARGGQV